MTWELRLGDCLDAVTGLASLGDKSVDHVICDPPYSEHVHSKSMRGAGPGEGEIAGARDFGFASLTAPVMAAVAAQVGRVVTRWALVFCDERSDHLWRDALEGAGLEYIRTCVWVKLGGAPQFTGDRPAAGHEYVILAHPKGRKSWNGGGKAGVYSCPIARADEHRVHTAQKPEGLMEALVKDFTAPGELICDPFAGSGTTGVAAIRLGRRFIGWERDPKYHAAAMKRLNAAREQMDMFERRVG